MKHTARDIGFLLRDLIEASATLADTVDHVDISDPHNPLIHMTNGQEFLVRISAARSVFTAR